MRSFALLLLSAAAFSPALAHDSSKDCAKARKHTKLTSKQRIHTLSWDSALGQYVEGSKAKGSNNGGYSVDWSKFNQLHASQGGQGNAAAPVMETHWVTKWSTQWTYETGNGGKANAAAPTTAPVKKTTSSAPKKTTTTAAPKKTTTTTAAPVAATTSAASFASTGSSNAASGIEKTVLDMHNSLRAKHGASALTWNTKLVDSAQAWGEKCVFQHGGGKANGAGENLSAYTGGSNVKWGVQMWVDEASLYDFDAPGFSSAVGHFTQMVWKDTTEIGCAEVKCPSLPVPANGSTMTNAYFLVCHYLKGGNIVGEDNKYFRLNVLPASS